MTTPIISEGVKHDQAKPPIALIDSLWISGVADVMGFGARKYGDQNWRGGITLSRLLSACLRHVFAFLGGEDLDPESGKPHLLHASCCLMMAYYTHCKRPELDDRYKEAK